ncbi:hypothetical protein DLR66_17380, partial [Vibrio paracholerae]
RVPTQIDWFILLKSFSYRIRFSAHFARAAYITLIQLSVKRYFLTFSSRLLLLCDLNLTPCQ